MRDLAEILESFKTGETNLNDAVAEIGDSFFRDLGHSTLDSDRARRNGSAEVIYGEHKTPQQIVDLVSALKEQGQNILITRVPQEIHVAVSSVIPDSVYYEDARLISFVQEQQPQVDTTIAVITAGTSDLQVAEEAARTAEFLGNRVDRINDVGVAGVHRLLARIEQIRTARVIIVVAGMEGALPSVVGGLVDKPVIAVPTSIGYGAALSGIAALLGMLISCSSGVSVVNIDNGFGAAYMANMINRL